MKKDDSQQKKQYFLMLLSMQNITEEEFRECKTAMQFKELVERKKKENQRRTEDEEGRN